MLAMLSTWHVLVILLAALLLFGNRLPEVARSMGRAMNEFKRGLRDVGDDTDLNADPPEKKPPKELNSSTGNAAPRTSEREAEPQQRSEQ